MRVPALANGLYGLRPTTRRLPYARVSNVLKGFEGIESTIGPLARSVDSLDVVMRAVLDAEPSLCDPKVVERVRGVLLLLSTTPDMLSSLPALDHCDWVAHASRCVFARQWARSFTSTHPPRAARDSLRFACSRAHRCERQAEFYSEHS